MVESTNKNGKIISLTILLIELVGVWILNNIIPNTKYVWFLGAIVVSIFFIMKNRNLEKNDIIVGFVLGGLSVYANPIMAITTIFAYVGAMSIFRLSRNNKIVLLRGYDKKNVIISLLLIIIISSVLGAINGLLISSREINLRITVSLFLSAMSAGIVEEIIFRFLLFAICVYITKDKVLSGTENILCYLIIIIPHALLHFSFTSFDIESMVILSLHFGLPFAVLLRKRDLLSAMGSHFLEDLIMLCVFGG